MTERTLVVTSELCPGEQLLISEHEVARARREVRKQLRELRGTDNFVRVEVDHGFVASVQIDFGEYGVREVLVDPLNLCRRLRPAVGRA